MKPLLAAITILLLAVAFVPFDFDPKLKQWDGIAKGAEVYVARTTKLTRDDGLRQQVLNGKFERGSVVKFERHDIGDSGVYLDFAHVRLQSGEVVVADSMQPGLFIESLPPDPPATGE